MNTNYSCYEFRTCNLLLPWPIEILSLGFGQSWPLARFSLAIIGLIYNECTFRLMEFYMIFVTCPLMRIPSRVPIHPSIHPSMGLSVCSHPSNNERNVCSTLRNVALINQFSHIYYYIHKYILCKYKRLGYKPDTVSYCYCVFCGSLLN